MTVKYNMPNEQYRRDLMEIYTVGKMSVNASILCKNQEIL